MTEARPAPAPLSRPEQIEEAEQAPTEASQPLAAAPVHPDDAGRTITAQMVEAEQQQIGSSDPSAAAPEQSNHADLPTTKQIEATNWLPTASQETPPTAPDASDDSGSPEAEGRFLYRSGIGLTPAPKLTCHARGGSCRYGACERSGQCLAAPLHGAAA
jgi:hypothetical protein